MKISDRFKKMCKEGLYWPFLHDPTTSKPSVTLLFVYISFLMCITSLVLLHLYKTLETASLVTIGFFCVCLVFYRLRKIDDIGVNLKSGQIEVKGSDEHE